MHKFITIHSKIISTDRRLFHANGRNKKGISSSFSDENLHHRVDGTPADRAVATVGLPPDGSGAIEAGLEVGAGKDQPVADTLGVHAHDAVGRRLRLLLGSFGRLAVAGTRT